MSNTEKKSTDITTMENHSPVPPALSETATQPTEASEPSTTEEITTLENHSPAPPALDLDGSK
ncbi:hypothetical protein [Streptomyces griseosporeus]|uniref:hypothetical protein n=1 Tax=Streptomyces griseosporeus TaxID=1910 RepID=UPI0036FA0E51